MDFTKILSEFGFGVTMATGVFVAFFFLLKWVLGASSDMLKQMAQERETWSKVQLGFTTQMQAINEQIKATSVIQQHFFEAVTEAHRFQREEHANMLANQKEIALTLGRINGYRHD